MPGVQAHLAACRVSHCVQMRCFSMTNRPFPAVSSAFRVKDLASSIVDYIVTFFSSFFTITLVAG